MFKSRLQQDIADNNYSHVIVTVVGMNTAQQEAIRNYQSTMSSIRMNTLNRFSALFIGITWPSFYANRWFDPIWEVPSYHPAADRADILGLSWLGVLLSDVISLLSDKVEASIVGYNFGARAATTELCVRLGITPQGGKCIRQNSRGTVEDFIRLPPPLSLPRFIDQDNRFF